MKYMEQSLRKISKQYNLPIIIEPCEEGGFFARCPVLPGCHVEAATISQALDFIEDAIRIYVESCLYHKDELPPEISAYETEEKIAKKLPLSLIFPIRLSL